MCVSCSASFALQFCAIENGTFRSSAGVRIARRTPRKRPSGTQTIEFCVVVDLALIEVDFSITRAIAVWPRERADGLRWYVVRPLERLGLPPLFGLFCKGSGLLEMVGSVHDACEPLDLCLSVVLHQPNFL